MTSSTNCVEVCRCAYTVSGRNVAQGVCYWFCWYIGTVCAVICRSCSCNYWPEYREMQWNDMFLDIRCSCLCSVFYAGFALCLKNRTPVTFLKLLQQSWFNKLPPLWVPQENLSWYSILNVSDKVASADQMTSLWPKSLDSEPGLLDLLSVPLL